ncbi:hypothetical protein [Sphingobacterium sp.]|uniref:hypothetical protein n=1 Tax=Sphingobacterium sp. TaxID=341027 RepID=UPI0028A8D0CC|nr:hypothetical protein [Sphingobacterium sp.]
MVIDRSKENNILTIGCAPIGCSVPILSLVHTASFIEVVYDIEPITKNQRYISFELPAEALEYGLYDYILYDSDREVNRGILNVFRGEFALGDESDDSIEYVYDNGE